MKKLAAAILVFDVIVGVVLLCVCGSGRHMPSVKTVLSGAKNVENEKEDEIQKKIAITFDDGPHPYYTEQLLDGLKERGVVASFFVTGEHAKLHPDVIKRMQEEGHLIGNHTYSHIQLTEKNREKFKEELIATNEVLREITGEETEFVRPPYGSWDKSFEKELNMFPVLWTVDPLDWSSKNVSRITEKIMNKAGENDIILMHDYYETSVTAALKVVDELLEEGYTFVTVEEILFD
ncbi:MAG: polysaccharide deacetylase family protein [Clostridium sp.]|nr:polysaccharide deacetylase family protein [Clostridium sp.]